MPTELRRRFVSLPRLAEGGPIEEIPIARLPISPRGIDCLEGEGVFRLGELLQMTPIDLLKVPNLGKRSQVEIMELLEAYGLSLKQD
jgi:DNA-directed RNA polymerase subunit alpha